jgi:hypothetical protein
VIGVRGRPCSTCPYRRDVPPGIWSAAEYNRLRAYDRPTGDQPLAGFACHTSPAEFCHGWAVVGSSRGHAFDLLALRLNRVSVPAAAVPLFASAGDAADHGLSAIDDPPPAAIDAIARLIARSAGRLDLDRPGTRDDPGR